MCFFHYCEPCQALARMAYHVHMTLWSCTIICTLQRCILHAFHLYINLIHLRLCPSLTATAHAAVMCVHSLAPRPALVSAGARPARPVSPSRV